MKKIAFPIFKQSFLFNKKGNIFLTESKLKLRFIKAQSNKED